MKKLKSDILHRYLIYNGSKIIISPYYLIIINDFLKIINTIKEEF